MKEAKDLSIIDKIIYYYNRALAVLLCLFLLYLDFQIFTVMVLGGYLIYKILYFSRKSIISLGISRFYFFGIIAYISILLSFLVPQTGIRVNFNGWNKISFSKIEAIADFFVHNIHNFMHWQMLVYSGVLGAVLYVVNVECTRRAIFDREMMAMQLQQDVLYNEVPRILTVLNVMLVIVLLFFHWALVGFFFIFNFIINSTKSYRYRVLINLLIIAICLLSATAVKSDFLSLPHIIFSYLVDNGVLSLLKYQNHNFIKQLHQGLPFLVPYYFIGFVVDLIRSNSIINSKLDRANIKRRSKEIAKKKQSNDINIGKSLINNAPVFLTHRELNQHALVCGTTGAGKTNTLCLLIENFVQDNRPVIMLDGKGSMDLADKLAKVAENHGKTFKLFTLHPELVPANLETYVASYNPFAVGTFTQWKNKVMSLFSQASGKGQEHYALAEETFLNIVVQILYAAGKPVDLIVINNALTDIEALQAYARKQNQDQLANNLSGLDPESVGDIKNMINLFIESSYGHLFNTRKVSNIINLSNALNNNEIILFMFDSSGYKSDTEKIAKMVINDINSTFSQLSTPIESLCIFDEFASYASPNLSDTISLQRSNGMHAVIGTQSVTTVGLKNSETGRIAEELIACCNTYIVQAINHDADAERFSSIFGTKKTHEVTSQIDVASGGGSTGMGSSKEVREFMVHPDQFKNQYTGEAYVLRKVLGLEPEHVKIREFDI
ncbi:MAG: type IV secretory system conjugative DNA transfer family protein [Neisseriaceae bacterium]